MRRSNTLLLVAHCLLKTDNVMTGESTNRRLKSNVYYLFFARIGRGTAVGRFVSRMRRGLALKRWCVAAKAAATMSKFV